MPTANKLPFSCAKSPWPWLAVLAAAMALPLFSTNAFHIHLAVLVCLNILVVNGLSLISRTGQLSFCHAAFMGLGAYGSVLASGRLGLPFAAGALLGVALAALVAWLLGALILRLKGVYFVLVTFCFGELLRLMLLEGGSLTGGANGIASIAPVQMLGFVFDSRRASYLLAAAVALASVAFLMVFLRTPAGQALDAVGENPELAEASGIGIAHTQRLAFVLGSAMAALGGVLLAHYLGFVSPESFSQHVSVAAIIMLVMGGRGSIAGPILGALIMTPLPELFRSAITTQNILYGITLMLVLRFLPQGLASLPRLRPRAPAEGLKAGAA